MVARSGTPQQHPQQQLLPAEGSTSQLTSPDAGTRLRALRDLKNQVIGNKFKKLQHLHLVPLLLELANSSTNSSSSSSAQQDPELQIQAIATLGSLAYGVEDGVRAITAANGISVIVGALENSDQRVVVAAARSLKLLYQVRGECRGWACCQCMHVLCARVVYSLPCSACRRVTASVCWGAGECLGKVW
jgi:hypothetical protein